MDKLSNRVMALEGPSFAIEQEIGRLINPQATRLSVFPAYTVDLNAAMSLVPEGWGVMLHVSENGLHSNVCLARSYPTNLAAYGEAKSPALALCAAALKARGL